MDVDDFPAALRAAIAASGQSLEEIRGRLAMHGVRVSIASLSYWQTGRSRPERAASLAALGPLEEVLGVPRGHLVSRVTFTRAGSKDATGAVGGPDEPRSGAGPVLEELGFTGPSGIRRRSIHDRIVLGAHGEQRRHRVQLALVAVSDRVERFPVWTEREGVDVAPTVHALAHCTVGRTHADPGHGAVGAEMLLDRPLAPGQAAVVEYEYRTTSPVPQETYTRHVPEGVREFLLELVFDPHHRPARASSLSDVDGRRDETDVCATDPLVVVVPDPAAGEYGLRWSW